MNKKISAIIAIVVLATTTVVVGFTVQQPAYAQLVKDPGASGFAPAADPLQAAGGWKPMEAPGQLKEGPHCIGCAAELSPGNQALLAGGIGQSQ
jgi:hypothetical protein